MVNEGELLWTPRPEWLADTNLAALMRWLERPRARGGTDLLLAPIHEPSEDSDPIYRYLDLLDTVQREHEDGSLLYVAATRAKRRLHLVGHAVLNNEGVPTPAYRSLLQRLWPALRGPFPGQAVGQHRLEIGGVGRWGPVVGVGAVGGLGRTDSCDVVGIGSSRGERGLVEDVDADAGWRRCPCHP